MADNSSESSGMNTDGTTPDGVETTANSTNYFPWSTKWWAFFLFALLSNLYNLPPTVEDNVELAAALFGALLGAYLATYIIWFATTKIIGAVSSWRGRDETVASE